MRRWLLPVVAAAAMVLATPAPGAPPTNDNFANAIALTGEFGQLPASSVEASLEPGEPNHAGEPGGASVWFRLTLPETSTWELHTCAAAASFDTLLAAYAGASVAMLTAVASNDDYCGISPGGSRVRVELAAGTYHLAVDDVDGVGGSFTLTWVRIRSTPRNTSPPTITGDPVDGNTLTAHPGTWTSDAGPISYAYRWERCNGPTCVTAGIDSTLVLIAPTIGDTIRVLVTATNRDGPHTVASARVGPVRAHTPVNHRPPRIVGKPNVGSELTLDFEGDWEGSYLDVSVGWQRCDTTLSACSDIVRDGYPDYMLTRADLGKVVRAVVTASNAAGRLSVPSNAIGAIRGRLCVVPRLRGKSLPTARRALDRSGCALGQVSRSRSTLLKGRIIRQSAKPGKRLKPRARVSVVLSLGRKR